MSLLKIRIYPDPVLRTKALPVSEIDDEVKNIVADMIETMYAGDGIGLAAPQVGISRQIVVMDIPSDEDSREDGQGQQLTCLINPKIVFRAGQVTFTEGCLSFPDLHIDVNRNEEVRVEYTDLDGQPQRLEAKGIVAVCLQHELDHLEGILFVDRLGLVRKKIALRDFERSQSAAGD